MSDKKYVGMADSNDVLLVFFLVAAVAFVGLLLGGQYFAEMFGVSLFTVLGNWWSIGGEMPMWANASLLAMVTISAILGGLCAWLIARGKEAEIHVKGRFLGVGPALLNRIEKPLIKRSGPGIKIGSLQLSRQREPGHMLFIGMPGSGKTVSLNSICQQIHARGDRMVVHDPKGDYVQWFDPKTTVIFGPWDARSALWDISADLDSAAMLKEAAAQWIPDSGGENSIFSQGARQFLTGLLFYLFKEVREGRRKDWGFRDLSALLQLEPAKAVKFCFDGYAPARQTLSLDEKGKPTKTSLSMIQNCASLLSWVHQLAAIENPGKPRISFIRWMKNQNAPMKNIILKNESSYESTAVALFGTVITIMKKTISQLPEVKPSAPGCWFLIDEFPQVGKQSGRAIAGLQEVGRSKGIRVITACQNIHQIYEIFDKDAGDSLTDLQQTKIYAQMSEQAAKMVSELSTKKLVNRHGFSTGDKLSESYSTTEVPVLSELDLRELKRLKEGVEVIVSIEAQPVKIVVPYPSINSQYPQFVVSEDFENGELDLKPLAVSDDESEEAEADEKAGTASPPASAVGGPVFDPSAFDEDFGKA